MPLAVERELTRTLPLPDVAVSALGPTGPDLRLATLPSDHRRRLDPWRASDANIHIPEPASIVLLATGAVGLLARRSLRRSQG